MSASQEVALLLYLLLCVACTDTHVHLNFNGLPPACLPACLQVSPPEKTFEANMEVLIRQARWEGYTCE
jgi:hypothetical protein